MFPPPPAGFMSNLFGSITHFGSGQAAVYYGAGAWHGGARAGCGAVCKGRATSSAGAVWCSKTRMRSGQLASCAMEHRQQQHKQARCSLQVRA